MTVPPEGNPAAALHLLGRDPGHIEMQQGRPFCGKAGQLLDRLLGKAAIRRQDCYIDNVIQTQPQGNDWNAHSVADQLSAKARIGNAIRTHKPKLVVAFGNEAFRTAMGQHPNDRGELPSITDARGYLWDSPLGTRVLAAIHPAATLREHSPWYPLTIWDLRKAKREVDTGCPPFPTRQVKIVTHESDYQEVRNACSAMPWISLDIENTAELQLACLEDRKSTRLNSSHCSRSRMPSSA